MSPLLSELPDVWEREAAEYLRGAAQVARGSAAEARHQGMARGLQIAAADLRRRLATPGAALMTDEEKVAASGELLERLRKGAA